MMLRATMIAALAALIFGATAAMAHTPCCEGKACPASAPYPKPGSAPDQAQCCTDAGLTQCSSAPNAGWACVEADPTNPMVSANGVTGCVQDETSATCIGGAITMGGPDGCISVGGALFIAGTTIPATPEDCTNAAVDACCANGGCGPDGD
jgi:hypothetical protein